MKNMKSFFIAGLLITPTFLQAEQTSSDTYHVSESTKAISKEKSVVTHRHKKLNRQEKQKKQNSGIKALF